MLAVRCDACGLKALVAASQCPHCGHLLDIRDSFGEMLPLVHCVTCDSSYLRRDGSCRWCGSTPEKVNYRPHIWKGVGALAFAGMAVGAWFTRDIDSTAAPDSLVSSTALLVGSPAPIESSVTADTASLRVAVPADSMVTLAATPSPATADTAPVPSPEPAVTAPTVPSESAPTIAVSPRKPITSRPPPRRAVRWTSAVVVSWVAVRSAPNRGGRLLGSVGPDSHVQLGEVRGDWRRIRMRGLAGWVKDGRFAPPRRIATKRRATP